MEKIDRSRRIQFLMGYIPKEFEPKLGIYFGEHVVRINGQLSLVVNASGQVGIRALQSNLADELKQLCADTHWVAHGRIYDQWYLLPQDYSLNDPQVINWIRESVAEIYRLSLIDGIPSRNKVKVAHW
ncbi:hypothetical protein [Reinekea thalattae]|uniref:MmcQ/YjbR family DNA-binding protein n=1 Tax=Reinekea thalattae TaxID=2593301 RepID=A0A5C8ZBI4_9GAMM|nr:hypothetical protein [Reinekea thalattae]TXR54256.1 hypothetical protein FME95_06895 [Reinekea thalattae]